MSSPVRLATAAIVVGSLALAPAAAEAHSTASPKSVKSHVRKADRSLKQVSSLVRSGDSPEAAQHVRRVKRQMRLANAEAKRLRRNAHGARSVKRAAQATKAVGFEYNRIAEVYAAIVDEAFGVVQLAIATTVDNYLVGREKAIEVLTRLMEVAPEQVRPYIAKVIALLSTDGTDEVASLTQALQVPLLPPEVGAALKQALEVATAAIEMATEQLQQILPLVPAEIRPIIEQALGLVTQTITQVTSLVTNLLGTLLGGLPGVPGTGETPGGETPSPGLLEGIFGSGFPFNLIPFDLPFNLPGFGFATR